MTAIRRVNYKHVSREFRRAFPKQFLSQTKINIVSDLRYKSKNHIYEEGEYALLKIVLHVV
jgi:hypothetical protein